MKRGRRLVKRIAVITHRRSEVTNSALREILAMCRELDIEAVIPRQEAEKSSLSAGEATVVPDLLREQVDFCVALGGDGTILRAFSRFQDMETPVLGINFGRIGFLSGMAPEEIGERLREVLRGNYGFMDLTLLRLVHGGTCDMAVNDVVVHKPEGGTSIRIGYAIGGLKMDSFSCDGMVISTAAGSTAYNLSNGGPVASLDLDVLIVSAIAPHTLRFRPLVLGGGDVEIFNQALGSSASICVDGRVCAQLPPGESLTVSISDRKAKLVRVPGTDFYRVLRDKFIHPPT